MILTTFDLNIQQRKYVDVLNFLTYFHQMHLSTSSPEVEVHQQAALWFREEQAVEGLQLTKDLNAFS